MYMTDVVKYFSKYNKMHLALIFLMLSIIAFPLPIPFELSSLIDTKLGSLLIVTFAIVVFLTVNPVIGILALFTGYVILHRAGISTGSEMVRKYVPNEDQKLQDMMNLHTENNDQSLEVEAVDNIPPRNPDENLLAEDPYKPVYSSSDIEHSEL